MSIEPAGWHMDAGSPLWSSEAKTFSFYLRKPGHDRVLCVLSIDVLEVLLNQTIFPRLPLAEYSMPTGL